MVRMIGVSAPVLKPYCQRSASGILSTTTLGGGGRSRSALGQPLKAGVRLLQSSAELLSTLAASTVKLKTRVAAGSRRSVWQGRLAVIGRPEKLPQPLDKRFHPAVALLASVRASEFGVRA